MKKQVASKVLAISGVLLVWLSLGVQTAQAKGCLYNRTLPPIGVGSVLMADVEKDFGYQFCEVEVVEIIAERHVKAKQLKTGKIFTVCKGRLYSESTAASIQKQEDIAKGVANAFLGDLSSILFGQKAKQEPVDC